MSISKYIVPDAYFSRYSFTQGLQDFGFHLVSRLRDDSNLLYLYQGEKTGKKGCLKTFDGKINVNNLDYTRMEKLDIYEEEGELYTLIAHSKALKRNIRLVIWITPKGAHKLYFSTETEMSGKDLIWFYRTRFQVEFCFRDSKQFTGLCHSQTRDINRLDFVFNPSMTAVNAAKIMMKENGIPFSMDTLKNLMYNLYMLKRFFELSRFKSNRKINAKFVKELIDIATYRAA